MNDERNDDIISEQTFSKEQAKSQAQNARRFKAIDAIEDREFDDREPLQTAVGTEDLDAAVSPQADSRGDSEEDATAEFLMGLNYRPESEDAFEEDDDEDDIEDFEKSDRTVYAEQKSTAASETPSAERENEGTFANRDIETLRDETRVVSSGRPSPRSDANSPTSVN